MLCPRRETRDGQIRQRLCFVPTAMQDQEGREFLQKRFVSLPPACQDPSISRPPFVWPTRTESTFSPPRFHAFTLSCLRLATDFRLIVINSLEWRIYPPYSELTPLYPNCRAIELIFCDVPRVYNITRSRQTHVKRS